MEKYTIKEINKDGNVVVYFEFDKSTQVLANAPTDDADALKAFLSDYLHAYKEGKELETTTVSNDVTALIGKSQTVQEA